MDATFTKQQRCSQCGDPLNQGDNWGCARMLVPFFGLPTVFVEVHEHVHIGCATGHVKWLALANLGHNRAELN